MQESLNENTPSSGKKISVRKGKVVEAIQETNDVWTLYIEVPASERVYQAGQFISIDPHQFKELSEIIAYLEHVKQKKELVRAYSLASAPHEPYLSITTKPERFYPEEMKYPPLLSPLLASDTLKGREITFQGYTGAYVLPVDHGKTVHEILHFVAGSGVVPNFSLLKDELEQQKNLNVHHIMIDVNNYFENIIYQKQLDELKKKYASRFSLYHFLTREEDVKKFGPHFIPGRPTTEKVKQLLKSPQNVLVYACGSAISKWQKKAAKETGIEPKPRFLESVTQIVQELGIDKKRFKKEVY